VRKVILGALLAAMAALYLVPAAMADAPSGYGFIEVCKSSTVNLPVSGPFQFTVDGQSVTVPTGGCSADMRVPAGHATVVEQSNAYTQVTGISTVPQDALASSNLQSRTSIVNVPAGDISNATTVQYINQRVDGTLEICKSAQEGSGLTGSFTFNITGPMGFSTTQTVPVGACSDSFRVPAGVDQVNEVGSNNTDLVGVSTVPQHALVDSNLAAATTSVAVAAGDDASNETIETFVNSTSRLKICKVAGDYQLNGTVYSFTANGATVQAVAEPYPGACVLVPTPYPGGTIVHVQEGITPGTAVSNINVSDNRAVPNSTDLDSRSVAVKLGFGQTVVTYTNRIAADGLLKVCKNAGSGVALGQPFSFSVGSGSLSVPAGFCEIAGSFPFNSAQNITEAKTAGLMVSSIATNPAQNLLSSSLSAGTAQVLIGHGVTEATFTNAKIGTPVGKPGTGAGTGAGSTPAPVVVPTSIPPITVNPTPVVDGQSHHGQCSVSAKMKRSHGRSWLLLKANGGSCHVMLSEYDGKGHVIKHAERKLNEGHTARVALSRKVHRVRTSIVL
jgi:hypothetical protein